VVAGGFVYVGCTKKDL
jgi:hypothetical protein